MDVLLLVEDDAVCTYRIRVLPVCLGAVGCELN